MCHTPLAPSGSVIRGDELLQARLQGRGHGKQREPLIPSSTTRARTATASAPSAGAGQEGSLRPGRRRSSRSRATDRRDDLRVVRRADHAATPGTDPQVVFGHLQAPSLGAGPGRILGYLSGGRRRAARRGPGACRADPSRLAQAARRTCPPAERRSDVRPRPSRPGPRTGAPTGGLLETGARDRSPAAPLRWGIRISAVAESGGTSLQSAPVNRTCVLPTAELEIVRRPPLHH